jgi:hypothetical protein
MEGEYDLEIGHDSLLQNIYYSSFVIPFKIVRPLQFKQRRYTN